MEITIQNQAIKAVIKSKGAELSSLQKDGKNYIWEINSEFWNKTSPILFPIVGALKNGEYFHEGKVYKLSRHGFARDFEFEVIENSENAVVFSLKSNEETLKVYPFHFELQLSYILEGNKLMVKYEIINRSSEKMYYSIGAHPAFNIDGNFEDFSLIFDDEKDLETYKLEQDLFSGKTEILKLNGNVLPLQYELYEEDALVFKNFATKSLTLAKNNESVMKVSFSDFPYLGIWTKKDAPFICIEPWLGIADNANASGKIEEKEGIQILENNSKKQIAWSVELF
ncbi:aldose 1-epimerase family protein [Cloacibacterium sp.]|uniref:aldose 1-epimerase family protein n=1 Tax=Cloacibacterium sp. TaxID=1913682 RepID=UPI0039E6A805